MGNYDGYTVYEDNYGYQEYGRNAGASDIDKEKREAREAGERALYSLREAHNQLNSARNWGLVDLFGGGFISGMIKHSKMSSAKQYMQQANYDLHVFSKEMQDVADTGYIDVDVSDFLSFADLFWDGFVSDIMVQSRIADARKQVEEAIDYVEYYMQMLY